MDEEEDFEVVDVITAKRLTKYRFLAPFAISSMPATLGEDAKPILLWAKQAATLADQTKPTVARRLFDIRSPKGCPAADTRKRSVNVMTNFIINEGTDFYNWLNKHKGVVVGWVDPDGRSRGLRQMTSKKVAERQARWAEHYDAGTHEQATEQLQQLAVKHGIEVNLTQLVPLRIGRKRD